MPDPGTAPVRGPVVAMLVQHRLHVVTAALLTLGSVAASLLTPLVVRAVVTDIGGHHSPVLHGVELVVLTLGAALGAAWSSFLLGRIGEWSVLETRRRLVRHVLGMRLRDLRTSGTGELAARVSSDCSRLRSAFDVGVTSMPSALLVAVLSLVLMGTLDWMLLLIVVVTFAMAGSAIGAFIRGVRTGTKAQQKALGSLNQRFTAALGAVTTIKANRAEQQAAGQILAEAQAAADASVSADRSMAFITPLMSVGQQLAIIGVLAGSGARLASGALSPGDFVAFMMYMFQLVSPLTLIATGIGRLQTGLAARGRIQGVLDHPAEEPGPPQAPPVTDGAPALRIEGLVGGHGSGPVLHGVELTVPRRGLTALVGPSGGGKSTVLSMIERLLLPDRGHLALHGVDLSRWPLEELRRRLSYVDQSFTLLEGTVRENLLLGLDAERAASLGDADLVGALAEVGMDEAVAALPDGLGTVLGGAVDLSGGQRQRLALARALLSEADVVLLDEPTSQLDGVNERMLRRAMDRLAADRAVLVVAHRLSTVRHADLIVCLDGGRTVGAGRHPELLESCDEYRTLVRGQHGTPEPAPAPA